MKTFVQQSLAGFEQSSGNDDNTGGSISSFNILGF
jgi:hypothetical protein